MDNMKNSESNNDAYKTSNNSSNNTFQGQNKQDASPKSGGCGCGCKSASSQNEDFIEIEEDDLVY